jgi:pyruvate formate lyase activating enzyme
MISNGFINPEPMGQLLDVLDGVKIDLKAFRNSFYRRLCDGELRPVLETLRLIRRRDVWLELVVLIVPTHNDSDAEMRAMARWVARELGPDVPLHLSRFHPTYRLTNLPRTSVATIERLRRVALGEGLRYVYLGNVRGHPGENTRCHNCNHTLIERDGFRVRSNAIDDGRCPNCQTEIPGVWS